MRSPRETPAVRAHISRQQFMRECARLLRKAVDDIGETDEGRAVRAVVEYGERVAKESTS